MERVNDEFQNVNNLIRENDARKPWPQTAKPACASNAIVSYRELRGDRRLPLVALRRAVEVAWAFRLGFLAAVFLVALRAVAGFVFVLVDRLVVELFFFGAAADFAFRVGVRFLAAPIAAPESAPITVPTTGTPSAVPATAPAAAPPTVLPAVPMPVSVGTLILIFVVHVSLPRLTETTLALVSLAVNKRLFVMHCREILVEPSNHCSAFALIDRPDWLPTPPPSCTARASERRKKAHLHQ